MYSYILEGGPDAGKIVEIYNAVTPERILRIPVQVPLNELYKEVPKDAPFEPIQTYADKYIVYQELYKGVYMAAFKKREVT